MVILVPSVRLESHQNFSCRYSELSATKIFVPIEEGFMCLFHCSLKGAALGMLTTSNLIEGTEFFENDFVSLFETYCCY